MSSLSLCRMTFVILIRETRPQNWRRTILIVKNGNRELTVLLRSAAYSFIFFPQLIGDGRMTPSQWLWCNRRPYSTMRGRIAKRSMAARPTSRRRNRGQHCNDIVLEIRFLCCRLIGDGPHPEPIRYKPNASTIFDMKSAFMRDDTQNSHLPLFFCLSVPDLFP